MFLNNYIPTLPTGFTIYIQLDYTRIVDIG